MWHHLRKRQKYLVGIGIKFIRVTNEESLGNPNKGFQKNRYVN
jgi:hypothetical protein